MGLARWRSKRFFEKIEKAQAWAKVEAARVTAGAPAVASIKVSSRNFERVAALDDALRAHGYLFNGWTAPNRITFREASDEIAFSERVLWSGQVAVFVTEEPEPLGYQQVQLLPEGLAIRPMLSVVFEKHNLVSFSLWERRLLLPGASWACITINAAPEGAKPPMHYLSSLSNEGEKSRFRDALATIGVEALPERTFPQEPWEWTTFNRASAGFG